MVARTGRENGFLGGVLTKLELDHEYDICVFSPFPEKRGLSFLAARIQVTILQLARLSLPFLI